MSISQRTVRTAIAALAISALGVVGACAATDDTDAVGAADAAAPLAETDDDAPADEATEPAEPEPSDEDNVVAVINRFHKAVDKGDGERACQLLTKDLQGVYAQNPGASDCAGGIRHLHNELDGAQLSDMEFVAADVELMRKGKEAVVSHELIAERNGTDPDETHSYNLEKLKGKWKISYIG